MQKQKILLFGAQGMLGSDIYFFFSELENYEIIPLSRFNVDIRDEEKVRDIIEKFSPDIVVNAMAFTNVDKCEDERWEDMALEVNAIAPEYIAKKCEEKKIPFYHFSTDYVFDGKKDESFAESDTPNPQNAYGIGKAEGEKRVLQYSTSRVLRTAWLAGDLGANFVYKIVHFSKTRPKVSVVEEYGNPSFTLDIAAQLQGLLENSTEEKIFHLVSDGCASRKELVEEIQDFLGLKTQIQTVGNDYFDLPAHRPQCSYLKNTLLPKARSWQKNLHIFLQTEKEKLDKKREIDAKKLRAKEIYQAKQAEENSEK